MEIFVSIKLFKSEPFPSQIDFQIDEQRDQSPRQLINSFRRCCRIIVQQKNWLRPKRADLYRSISVRGCSLFIPETSTQRQFPSDIKDTGQACIFQNEMLSRSNPVRSLGTFRNRSIDECSDTYMLILMVFYILLSVGSQ